MKFFFLASFVLMANAFAKTACDADAQKFCPGVDFGKGQVAQCLVNFKDQLSSACAQEMKKFDETTSKKNPCYKDLAEFCADVPTDPAKLEICLLKNENRLSATCSKDFKQKKPKLIVKNECAQDIANVCYPEVAGPEGAINKCLFSNRAKLSKFCQTNIDLRMTKLRQGNPCFDESMKYCPKAVKVIDIQECLEKRMAALNANCQRIVQKETAKSKNNPCYKDLVRHCRPKISPEDQTRCLVINEKELSSACRQFRVNKSAKIESMVKNCEADRLKLCAKEPMQGGKVVKCLRKNKDSVSAACKALL